MTETFKAPKKVRDYWAMRKREYRAKKRTESLPSLESLPGCLGNYGNPSKPNGPCQECEAQSNCKAAK
jgi:hypothetical protein